MESGEQFMCLNSGEDNFQRITGTESPRASVSFSSLNLTMMPAQKEGEADSLSEASNDSEDIGIIEDSPMENIREAETDESPSRETVSLFSAALGPSTDQNTESEEPASTHNELVVASSQDGRDEEKQLENGLGVGDKTSEDLRIGDKTSEDLGTENRMSEDLAIEGKTNEDLATEDKTSEDPGIEDKTSDDLVIGAKTIEDVGDDCDGKEKERMEDEEEKRAAKRPRLSSTGEVEEMEIN